MELEVELQDFNELMNKNFQTFCEWQKMEKEKVEEQMDENHQMQ